MARTTDHSELRSQLPAFDQFVAHQGVRLRRVLVAQFGVDLGPELCADALAYAWENWSAVSVMANPAGYLYRVARSSFRRHRRWRDRVVFPAEFPDEATRDAGGDIFQALGGLSDVQRTCVVLVHAHQWSYAEVATVVGISTAAVTNHVHRGLARLRKSLGEDPER